MAGISGKKWSRRKSVNFVDYIRETWLNKLSAIALLVVSSDPMIHENDATAFVLALFIAIPLFFSRKSWVW